MARVGSWRRKKADGADLFPLLKTRREPPPPAELPWDKRFCTKGLSQEDVMATNKPVGDNAFVKVQ